MRALRWAALAFLAGFLTASVGWVAVMEARMYRFRDFEKLNCDMREAFRSFREGTP